MATTVKIDEETKADLEELQAEIRLKTSTRVTQQELLARLVDRAIESRDDLVDLFRDDVEVSAADREAFHAGMIDSGSKTTEDHIDDELYG